MKDFKDLIKINRPKLTDRSINTYNSILTSLYKKVFNNTHYNIDILKNNIDKIINFLENKNYATRKTIYASVYIITNNPKINELMMTDIKKYNIEVKKNEMSDKQKANLVTKEEMEKIYNEYQENTKQLYKKKSLTNTDIQYIQDYIILSLYTLILPRRAMDYVELKIRNINKEVDNFIDKNKIVFNKYKGSLIKGQQVLTLPNNLKNILNKWININDSDYLLIDVNKNKLNSVKLTQRINKIFKRNFAINGFRHFYLTNKYGETMKDYKKMEEDMNDMGSSIAQSNIYVNFDN